jgi:signal peptide peptidase SppA
MKAILESQEVLLIDPRRWAAQLATVQNFRPGAFGFTNEDDEDCDIYGEAIEKMSVDADGIAVVPICGTIATGLPSIAAAFGFVDTARIRADIENALADTNVKAIVLNFDSPGGFVTGTPELGEFIARAAEVKPVYSFTSGLCCSAAYWLAAPSRAIFATTSSEVGSVGVYVAHKDYSAMARMMGLAVKVFSSGKFKGAGEAGTSLSEEQSADLQSRVDSIAALFKTHVLQYRPGIAEDSMQGQTFMGYQAAAARFTDGMVSSLSEAKKILLAGA